MLKNHKNRPYNAKLKSEKRLTNKNAPITCRENKAANKNRKCGVILLIVFLSDFEKYLFVKFN
jgi:hypothetical protein